MLKAKMKKRRLKKVSANDDVSFDLPASLTPMAAQARPVRIVMVDIDQPLPDLRANDHYSDACVVVCQKGVPRCMEMIDLTIGVPGVQSRMRELLAESEIAGSKVPQLPTLADADLPRISIVVPTIVARTEELLHCIESIELLDYPNFEVLLVDNRRVLPAHDPLPALVKDRPSLRVIREPRPGISAARNEGVKHADADVIAFTDDDVQVDHQWLRAIGARLVSDPNLDAVTGLILPAELESPSQIWFERYYGGFNGPRTFTPLTLEPDPKSRRLFRGSRVLVRDFTGAEVRRFAVYGVGAYAAGANMAFRRSTLERSGGFDVALGTGTPARGGEDLAALIAILWSGGRVGYEPTAVVHHRHRRSYDELLTQMEGNGLGFTAMLASLVRDDPRHLLGLSSQLPIALKNKAVEGAQRIRGMSKGGAANQTVASNFPSTLARREFRAYLRGPAAYAGSRSASRKMSKLE